jgi:hypothetical protein
LIDGLDVEASRQEAARITSPPIASNDITAANLAQAYGLTKTGLVAKEGYCRDSWCEADFVTHVDT